MVILQPKGKLSDFSTSICVYDINCYIERTVTQLSRVSEHLSGLIKEFDQDNVHLPVTVGR